MTDQQKLEHFISCLRAHVEKRKVEFNYPETGWSSDVGGFGHTNWRDFNPSNWRVKPDALKVVPHTWETTADAVKGRRKSDGASGWINPYPREVVFVQGITNYDRYTYAEAAKQFELLDGSPYGIPQKEESEQEWWITCDGDLFKRNESREQLYTRYAKNNGYKRMANDWTLDSIEKYYGAPIPAAEAQAILAQKEVK